MDDCFCVAELCNIKRSVDSNRNDGCKNGTNTLVHISTEITYIKKSIRYEMQHLMQIDELLLKFLKIVTVSLKNGF